MTGILNDNKPSLDDLAHHGVKGMKWGTHRENRLQLNQRVAAGTGSRGDRARVALTQLSSDSVRRSGGLQNAAGNKAKELQGRKDRIQKGEATVRDFMALHGGDRLVETSGKKFANK